MTTLTNVVRRLGDLQARKVLEAAPADTLKGISDRAILATLLHHGIHREDFEALCFESVGCAQPAELFTRYTQAMNMTPFEI